MRVRTEALEAERYAQKEAFRENARKDRGPGGGKACRDALTGSVSQGKMEFK